MLVGVWVDGWRTACAIDGLSCDAESAYVMGRPTELKQHGVSKVSVMA